MFFYALILTVYALGYFDDGNYIYSANYHMLNYLSEKKHVNLRVKYNVINMNGVITDEYQIGRKKIYIWFYGGYNLRYDSTHQVFEMKVSGDSVFLYLNKHNRFVYDNNAFLVPSPIYLDKESTPYLKIGIDFIDSVKDGEYKIYSDDLETVYGDVSPSKISIIRSRNMSFRDVVDLFSGKEYKKVSYENVDYDRKHKNYKISYNDSLLAIGGIFTAGLLLENNHDSDYSMFLVDKDTDSVSEICFFKKIFYENEEYLYQDYVAGFFLYNGEYYVKYDKEDYSEKNRYLIAKYSKTGDVLEVEKVLVKKSRIFR